MAYLRLVATQAQVGHSLPNNLPMEKHVGKYMKQLSLRSAHAFTGFAMAQKKAETLPNFIRSPNNFTSRRWIHTLLFLPSEDLKANTHHLPTFLVLGRWRPPFLQNHSFNTDDWK